MYINVALAQINPLVGDPENNTQLIMERWQKVDDKAHLVVFPELSISGYPPEDLLLRWEFVKGCEKALNKLVEFSKSMKSVCVVGTPYWNGDLYNALVILQGGKVLGIYRKRHLPNYSVFDEKRYFRGGEEPLLMEIDGVVLGFSVCEDIWHPDGWERYYATAGADILININASPYHMGKYAFKEAFLKARAEDNLCYVVYVNSVGGQDELVFDGRSLVIDPEGNVIARCKAFEEDLKVVSLDVLKGRRKRLVDVRLRERPFVREKPLTHTDGRTLPYVEGTVEHSLEGEEELYRAVVLSIKEYVEKNGFRKVVVGLSGGIDSSLVACMAVDALGEERVVGVFMPSVFTSEESRQAVYQLVKNLRIQLLEFPIEGVMNSYKSMMGWDDITVAEENLQSRIRANILFYLSNRYGYLVLSTSNKSELATGYGTIYGDMAGGFAPLKDLYKTYVYRLAYYRNRVKEDIPSFVLTRPPTAELRPHQKDEDTLPPYPVLDKILFHYIEEGLSVEEIVRRGFERELVCRVVKMIKSAEYKRKQSPLGPKLTSRAFGKDWRVPITNGWRDSCG